MKWILVLVLLTSCATTREPKLSDVLMQHKQGNYFNATEYLEWKERNETTR